MANFRSRLGRVCLVFSAVAPIGALAQQSPTVTTGALPLTTQSVVPRQIDPIVPPAVVAPVARAKPRARPSVVTLPTCRPGERLQRKIGTCMPIAISAVAKSAPAKTPTKLVKAKPANKRS